MGLVDAASGNVVASYEYDPFGHSLDAQGDQAALNANPFLFSTKYFDAETGLYYYGMRYYSPELGRWMTRDPLAEEGGVNVYAFVGNDPANGIDPDGRQSLLELGDQIFEMLLNGDAKEMMQYSLAGWRAIRSNPEEVGPAFQRVVLAVGFKNLDTIDSARRNPLSFGMGVQRGLDLKATGMVLGVGKLATINSPYGKVGLQYVTQKIEGERQRIYIQQRAMLEVSGIGYDQRAFINGRHAGFAIWETGQMALTVVDPVVGVTRGASVSVGTSLARMPMRSASLEADAFTSFGGRIVAHNVVEDAPILLNGTGAYQGIGIGNPIATGQFSRIAKLRADLGLPVVSNAAANPTLTIFEIGGKEFFGANSGSGLGLPKST